MKVLLEPDMWWYLRTGEWILENGQVPTEDVFSYTFSGVEWINVKWGYEVIVYLFSQIGGVEFTSIFQAIMSSLIVFSLFGIYRTLNKQGSIAVWSVITLIAILTSSFRMTARPETISHLFSLLVLLIYFKSKDNKKLIYLWIPLQILWTNLHEAYATGLVIMGSIAAWELVQSISQKENPIKNKIIQGALGGLFAVVINPRGFQMLLHPLEIFRQLGDNKFTKELFSWKTTYYWEQWQTNVFLVFLGLLVLSLFLGKGYKLKESMKERIENWSPGVILVLALFAYLGFSAHRNIPFLVLASSPFIASWVSQFLGKKLNLSAYIPIALSGVLAITTYSLVISNTFYELTNSKYRYGLQVDAAFNPIGLTNALKEIDYTQPHFSDYLSSAYPLWKIKDYKSFIDLRDLDIFPSDFFQEVIMVTQVVESFDQLDSLNGFQFAYLKRTDFGTLITHLQQHPNWKLKFSDPIAVMFVKEQDTKHTDRFQDLSTLESSTISAGFNKLFNPLYQSVEREIDIDMMAASFFNSTLDFELALGRLEDLSKNKYDKLLLRSDAYMGMSQSSQQPDSLIRLAWATLNEAKQLERKNGKAYFKSGMILFQTGRPVDAVSEFKISVKHDPTNANAWSYLAECQNALMQSDPNNQNRYVRNWFEYMEKAAALEPEADLLKYRIGISYCERNECEKAAPYLKGLAPMPYLSDADNQNLLRCKEKCAVD